MQELKAHELANFYPMQDAARFAELVDGMKKSGYRDEFPIVIYEGKILDGRNRYAAAIEAGVKPFMVQFSGDDAVDFVVQANSNRRDLTVNQRAAIGLSIVKYKNEQGKNNMIASGGDKKSNDYKSGLSILTNPIIPVNARKEAAALFGVSEGTMAAVIQIEKEQPMLIEKIARGEMTIREAKEIIAPHVSHNSGENEWYTPAQYIEAAYKVMGAIDFDPASSAIANKTVNAKKFYTKQDDGLNKEWQRGRVWMNPPYSSDLISAFVDKYVQLISDGGSEGIVLVNNATETAWFQKLVSVSNAVVFSGSRIKFLDTNGKPGAPLQGQAIIYAGKNVNLFIETFSAFGWSAQL